MTTLSHRGFQSYLRLTFCSLLFSSVVRPLLSAEPADTNYDEQQVPSYTLPALFPDTENPVNARATWQNSRRAEILALFEQHVYGKTPSANVLVRSRFLEKSHDALGGLARRRQVQLVISPADPESDSNRSIYIELLVYTPKEAKGPVPAFIGLNFYGNQTVHPDPEIRMSQRWMRGNSDIGIVNHRATDKTRGVYQNRWQVEMVLKRGYGLVTAYYGDIDPDNYRHDFTDGVHPLFYVDQQSRPADDQWGSIGAWAWGLSTILDWLEDPKNDSLVDASRLAVIGHSRLGKTALWAGAQDQRFAMVISNNSGCGGAALYRRCYGERIHHMIQPVGYWFCKNHAQYAHREAQLPVDQHMLLGLIAPRPLYVASAAQDQWSDPRGEFLAARIASKVYRLFDVEGIPEQAALPKENQPVIGRIGYHVRSGDHDVTSYDWQQYLEFADRHLSKK